MKGFLKLFPFLLAFVAVFALQVQWDVNNQVKPFLEPFGRESFAGDTTANRQAQPLGEGRFLWLNAPQLTIGTIDAAGQRVEKEERPVPAEDLLRTTNFKLAGDEIFWVGDQRVLKAASWQNGAWSAPRDVAQEASALAVVEAGGTSYLLAGLPNELKVWKVKPGALEPVRSFPVRQGTQIGAATDGEGRLHLGVVDQLARDNYVLWYGSFDGKTLAGDELKKLREVQIDSSSSIDEMAFGIDRTHAYQLLTFKSTRANNRDVRLVSVPLNNAGAPSDLIRLSKEQGFPETSYAAYAEAGQGDALRFVFVAPQMKNPRVEGTEVFLATLQDGKWTGELSRLSNTQKSAANPVLVKQGETTTAVFSVVVSYNQYKMHYNADDPSYAEATNVLRSEDYKVSAMQVPQYLGMAAILMVMVMAWPLLSYGYLVYLLLKKEDQLYDMPNRHVWISMALYFVSQVWVFVNYGKFENVELYGPEWMTSMTGFSLLLGGLLVIAYLFTMMYAKLRYERYALAEFSYFFGLNTWTAILTLSYFMAP